MLRNVGKSGWARKMKEVVGWVAMDYPVFLYPLVKLFGPHAYVNINCNIINIFKNIFSSNIYNT